MNPDHTLSALKGRTDYVLKVIGQGSRSWSKRLTYISTVQCRGSLVFYYILNTRSSAIAEIARNQRRSIVRCKRHFDMLNRSKACASIIINV